MQTNANANFTCSNIQVLATKRIHRTSQPSLCSLTLWVYYYYWSLWCKQSHIWKNIIWRWALPLLAALWLMVRTCTLREWQISRCSPDQREELLLLGLSWLFFSLLGSFCPCTCWWAITLVMERMIHRATFVSRLCCVWCLGDEMFRFMKMKHR